MANFNINLIEDRDNLFKDFQDIERIFFESNRNSRMETFCLMLPVWERASKDLWELGYWQDYFRCGNIVLRCTTFIQGDILNQIGWNYMEEGKFAIARSYFQESLRMFTKINSWDGQCEALRYLGVLYHRQRRFGSAIKSYQKALNIIATKLDINLPNPISTRLEAHAAEIHNVLGNLFFKLGDFASSFKELNLAIKKFRSLGDDYIYYQVGPLLNLGRWYFLQGNYMEARRYYKECLRVSQQINRIDTKVGVLKRLAELANAQGDKKKATRLALRAQHISGREIREQRDQIARFQESIEGKQKREVYLIVKAFIVYCQMLFDLALYDPCRLIQFIIYSIRQLLKHFL